MTLDCEGRRIALRLVVLRGSCCCCEVGTGTTARCLRRNDNRRTATSRRTALPPMTATTSTTVPAPPPPPSPPFPPSPPVDDDASPTTTDRHSASATQRKGVSACLFSSGQANEHPSCETALLPQYASFPFDESPRNQQHRPRLCLQAGHEVSAAQGVSPPSSVGGNGAGGEGGKRGA